jgi:hypothetical protein
LFDAVGEFFDYGVGKDLLGDALDLGFGGVGGKAIGKREGEVFALAHRGDISETDLVEGILDGLSLRIEDGSLQRDINMRLHCG